MVIKGTVKEMDAAVKTVKNDDANGSHLRSLLSEIKVLQYIGKFENIVSMLGCHTSQLTNGICHITSTTFICDGAATWHHLNHDSY